MSMDMHIHYTFRIYVSVYYNLFIIYRERKEKGKRLDEKAWKC